MEVVGWKWAFQVNQKIKKIVAMGANLNLTQRLLTHGLLKMLFKRKLVKQKLKKRTLIELEITKLLGLLGDQPNIPIKDLSKKSKSVNYRWR
jgi:hypothetical protein